MRCWLHIGLGIGIAFFSCVEKANADLSLSFRFDQSNYVVSPDGQASVEVFLRQTGIAGVGQTNILGGPEAVGMTGTGVLITFPTGPSDAEVLSTSDITGNSDFDNFGFPPFTMVDANSALLSQATFGTPVLGALVEPDTFDLLVGTFVFTAGSMSPHVTPIHATIPLFPHSNDNVAATIPFPTSLLNISDADATITVGTPVQAVPEPNTLAHALVGLLVIAGPACCRRVANAGRSSHPRVAGPECLLR